MDSWTFFYDFFNVQDGEEIAFWGVLFTALGAASAVIALVGVMFTYHQYRQKNSTKMSARYFPTDYYGKYGYEHAVMLNNYRDRTEVIFGIYLRLGLNYYINLKEFFEQPLIIHPFESIKVDLTPMMTFSLHMNMVEIDFYTTEHSIILSTGSGKYKALSSNGRWTPCDDKKNHTVESLVIEDIEYEAIDGRTLILSDSAVYIVRYAQNGLLKENVVYRDTHNWFDSYISLPNLGECSQKQLLDCLQNCEELKEKGVDLNSFEIIIVDDLPQVKSLRDELRSGEVISLNPIKSGLFFVLVGWVLRIWPSLDLSNLIKEDLPFFKNRALLACIVLLSLIIVVLFTWLFFFI